MNPFSAVEARVAGLVHASARSDPEEQGRHERLLVARLTAGALALAVIPPFLLWRGAPSPAEHLVLAAMAGPLIAAAVLARTGLLALSQAIVSLALAAPLVAFAAASGDAGPAAALALLVLPAEGSLSGSRRAAAAAGLVAVGGIVAILCLGVVDAGTAPSAWLLAPAFLVVAAGHGAVWMLARPRREVRRDADSAERPLLQVIDDLVTWHDRNGHVLEASPAAAKLLGLPPAALRGRGLFSRVHVSDRPAFLRAVGEAALGERPVAAEFRLHAEADRTPDGERGAPRVVWVEMRAHRVAGAPAEGAAVVAMIRDVSDRKRREEELEGAKREAERSDLSKGRLLATVSHELRTPLNAIIGFSEMLAAEGAGGLEDGKRREYAGIVRDSGRHLLDLANTLLDVSRLETGDLALAVEPTDVGALVHGCCDLLALTARDAGVELVRRVAPDLPELVADRRACRQILINLVSNAIKFTPRGGQVRVAAARDRDRIVLTVSDTGVGVADADLPRLGDPFFQAGRSAGRSGGGAGLGLSVVRGLVALHRGTLAIESALGKGTAVIVGLPLDGRVGASRPDSNSSVVALPRTRALAKVG